ncbi:armadillo-type protein [Baffinella frigidus]|nr:armadillo-type protein [Cryptophyta sp. CCMP2293]
MSDAKYFQTTKRGEIHELKEELHTNDKQKQKEAVKKVIAAMTVGKDVSMLFPDVCSCMQTPNLELKKLVYLYLINYAKSQPDLAIMAVNTFVKDASDPNPLIRALAVRTMGCIRVEQITEYLANPLSKALKDEDPYVRKTAAICVCKLHDINPEMVKGGPGLFELSRGAKTKMLAAINECAEWGQVAILDALAMYPTNDPKEAESIIERVTPRLQHANAAVVLSAVKVVLHFMDLIESEETLKALTKKLSPPMVTLLSAEPEIQYVALRNIQLICQKRPGILANEIKVFFCKYNDPSYVKVEKVDVMVMLASERNVDQVLMELKEYAFAEVDVEFVRKAVRAIGRCALKIDKAAERCVTVLLDLIQTKVSYVVQESIVVIKDIFRKYPNKYESVIGVLCENLEGLESAEAKASLIWIIGHYAERIDNAQELLEGFIEEFADLDLEVQLQLLTATVLGLATTGSTNPDLRDRGYIYWRLLSSDPDKARVVRNPDGSVFGVRGAGCGVWDLVLMVSVAGWSVQGFLLGRGCGGTEGISTGASSPRILTRPAWCAPRSI